MHGQRNIINKKNLNFIVTFTQSYAGKYARGHIGKNNIKKRFLLSKHVLEIPKSQAASSFRTGNDFPVVIPMS
jgi:hypothetical protein